MFGAMGFFWAFFFFRWFRDTPDAASGRERRGTVARWPARGSGTDSGHGHGGAPWTKFFTNRSVWLLCLQYACLSYGFWFYLTWLPTYIREVFGMKEADRYLAGALAGLPLFLAGVSVYLTGKVTPWLIERVGSVARVRRGLGAAGCGIASLMLVVSVTQHNPVLAMLAMGVSCFGNDMAMPGSWTAVMDLGGRYAGTLAGIMNMMGMVGGLLAPWTIPLILRSGGRLAGADSRACRRAISSVHWRGWGSIRSRQWRTGMTMGKRGLRFPMRHAPMPMRHVPGRTCRSD